MNLRERLTYSSLPNGLRLVHYHLPATQAEYCGLAVKVGSRDETPATYGMAHFVEHTIFKGTDHRHATHIINRMETVGGEINAYTTEEMTMIYTSAPRGNMARALELMADLVACSRFPAKEIDKEREVVMDEVSSYLDTPADAVFDDFNDLMFAGSSLGHNILGTKSTIASFTPEACRQFLDTYYVPERMVLYYAGGGSFNQFQSLTERYFSHFHHPAPTVVNQEPPVSTPFRHHRKLATHQSHTVVGARIPGLYHPEAHVFGLLTNMVGGPCMNSLFNVALRERRGLVYAVDAYTTHFTDCGLFSVYFGCDRDDVAHCCDLILEILHQLASSPLTTRKLEAAKKQYLGQTRIATENREQRALAIGRSTLFHGQALTMADIQNRIASISPESLQKAAQFLTPDLCSILTFGR